VPWYIDNLKREIAKISRPRMFGSRCASPSARSTHFLILNDFPKSKKNNCSGSVPEFAEKPQYPRNGGHGFNATEIVDGREQTVVPEGLWSLWRAPVRLSLRK